jgi:hypothetical protein
VEKTRRGPQFLSPYEARYALGGQKKKKKPTQPTRDLYTTDDGVYQLGKIFIIIATAIYFVLSCFTLQRANAEREKKNAANTQKKNVM